MVNKKNQWVTAEDPETGETKRYNLASMQKLGISIPEGMWGQGVSLEEVYFMPRAKKLIIETYSIWENPKTHGCYGTHYGIASNYVIGKIAQYTDDEVVMALVPEGE
jgi:hypothetical protein